jgi:hypothetical protein
MTISLSDDSLTITNLVAGQPVTGSFYHKSSGTTAPTFTISGLTDLEEYTVANAYGGDGTVNFTGNPAGETFTITPSYSGNPSGWLAQVSQVSLV